MKRFPLSAMLTSLPLDFEASVVRAAELGFTHADIVALEDRPEKHREALADSGLLAGCAALGRGLPEGHGLDVASIETRRATLERMKRQVDDAAVLGATLAYVVSGTDDSPDALKRFADGLALLAEYTAARMVRLCLEPVPRRAMNTAAGTLDWLEGMGLVGVKLLLDVGHCLISEEDAGAVVRRAGPRLGHVHLDDNNGVDDLHWPLFSGRLTRDALKRFLTALAEREYDGILAFELNPQLANAELNLREGKRLVEELE